MTAVKIAGKPSAHAADAIGRHAATLYASPGKTVLGVIELKHAERMQPAPDEDKEPTVTLRVAHLEIAEADQEEALRQAMRALYIARTAQGTLDDEGEVALSERTLEMTADRLLDLEVARLVTACRHWSDYARKTINIKKLNLSEARHELENIAQGLLAAIGIKPTSGE
jgi:hypothetical protein